MPETERLLLPPDYEPSDKEEYMNPRQLEYFRQQLLAWKEDILKAAGETLSHIREEVMAEPDPNDRASRETDMGIELRTRDRQRKLINKINDAIKRIDDESYGYCEETGDPIGLARLKARPIATLSIAAQERHEKFEKTHRDDDEDY